MKRRVLRTHNNKKAFRTIQAAHGLKEPHHVLCDETFLRAVVGQRDVESVRSLISDCGLGNSYVLHVLPETLRNLERHQHFKALEYATSNCVLLSSDAPTAAQTRAPDATSVASASTATTTTAPSQQPASDRNELKAVAATIKNSMASSSATSSKANNFFFFVATQSHDLRALLPPSAAILRATFKPTAVWIEINNTNESAANLRDAIPSATSSRSSQQRRPSLSGADAAFLESLGINNKTGKKRVAQRVPRTLETSATTTTVGDQTSDGAASNAAATPLQQQPQKKIIPKKDNKPKGANPLSMKKKTPRETFSFQQNEPPKNKRRVES